MNAYPGALGLVLAGACLAATLLAFFRTVKGALLLVPVGLIAGAGLGSLIVFKEPHAGLDKYELMFEFSARQALVSFVALAAAGFTTTCLCVAALRGARV
jgi:hypothetical protein